MKRLWINKKQRFFVIMTGLVFIISLLIIAQYVFSLEDVYVARDDLDARHRISENDLEKIQLPRKYISREMVQNKAEVIGLHLKHDTSIYKDNIIFKNQLEDIQTSSSPSFMMLEEGEALFAIKASTMETFGNQLKIGHRVDIYVNTHTYHDVKSLKMAESIRVVGLRNRDGNYEQNGNIEIILLAIDENYIDNFVKAQSLGDFILTGRNDSNESIYYDIKEILNV